MEVDVSTDPAYQWWRDAVAGRSPDVHDGHPEVGYFRSEKGRPVSLWWDQETGEMRMIIGTQADYGYADPTEKSSWWLLLSRRPVPEYAYWQAFDGYGWPDDPLPTIQPSSAGNVIAGTSASTGNAETVSQPSAGTSVPQVAETENPLDVDWEPAETADQHEPAETVERDAAETEEAGYAETEESRNAETIDFEPGSAGNAGTVTALPEAETDASSAAETYLSPTAETHVSYATAETFETVGHNQPPSDPDSPEFLLERLLDLEREGAALLVTDQMSADRGANIKDSINAVGKRVEELRVAEKRPYDDIVKQIQEKWRPIFQRVPLAAGKLTDKITAWMKVEKAARELAAAQEAEQARARGEVAPRPVGRPRAGGMISGRRTGLKETRVWAEITDYDACLQAVSHSPEIRSTVQQLADRAARGNNPLPGTVRKSEHRAA